MTRLVLESQDRRLDALDRVALWLHWRVCDACRNFRTQALAMRRSLAHWRNERDRG